MEAVAAVDINPEALANPREHLGLRDDRCYRDIERAFAENKADFAIIVVPPAFHEAAADVLLHMTWTPSRKSPLPVRLRPRYVSLTR